MQQHPAGSNRPLTDNTMLDGSACRVCGQFADGRHSCAGCQQASYCSPTHQQADWPAHSVDCSAYAQLLGQQPDPQSHQPHQHPLAAVNAAPASGLNYAAPTSSGLHYASTAPPAANNDSFQMAAANMQQELRLQQQHHHNRNFARENTMSVDDMNLPDATLMLSPRDADLCKIIINDLNKYGLAVIDDFLGNSTGRDILDEVKRMHGAGVFQNGQLVSSDRQQSEQTIRGDKITWVKGTEPACSSIGYLINQIDHLVISANRMRDNGTLGQYNIRERTKAMVACYPGSGAHYVMHVDNPNRDGRVITAIYYLNLDWNSSEYGGRLTIHPRPGNRQATIDPSFDRILFFWSDRRNPHEVHPAHRTRYAITVWYFDAEEREAALNRNRQQQQVQPMTTPTAALSSYAPLSASGLP